MELVRVRHDCAHMHLIVGESYKENYTISIPAHLGYFSPRLLQYYYFFQSCKFIFLNESLLWGIVKDKEAWHAAVHGVKKSRT